jgi:hypothetical protein
MRRARLDVAGWPREKKKKKYLPIRDVLGWLECLSIPDSRNVNLQRILGTALIGIHHCDTLICTCRAINLSYFFFSSSAVWMGITYLWRLRSSIGLKLRLGTKRERFRLRE